MEILHEAASYNKNFIKTTDHKHVPHFKVLRTLITI